MDVVEVDKVVRPTSHLISMDHDLSFLPLDELIMFV